MAKRRSTTEQKDMAAEQKDMASGESRKPVKSAAGSKSGESGRYSDRPVDTPEPGLSIVEYHARIARKAYDLFERRGRSEGHDVEDWLEAERLVKEELLQHGEVVIS